jgi:hypothetical protein
MGKKQGTKPTDFLCNRIEKDLVSMNRLLAFGEWQAVVVIGIGIVEALISLAIWERGRAWQSQADKEGIPFAIPSVFSLGLRKLLKLAVAWKLVGRCVRKDILEAYRMRNSIHAGYAVNQGYLPNRPSAEFVASVVETVMLELSQIPKIPSAPVAQLMAA